MIWTWYGWVITFYIMVRIHISQRQKCARCFIISISNRIISNTLERKGEKMRTTFYSWDIFSRSLWNIIRLVFENSRNVRDLTVSLVVTVVFSTFRYTRTRNCLFVTGPRNYQIHRWLPSLCTLPLVFSLARIPSRRPDDVVRDAEKLPGYLHSLNFS